MRLMLFMLVLLYPQPSLYCLRLILNKTTYSAKNKQLKVSELMWFSLHFSKACY